MIREFSHVIKESGNHIVFYSQLRHLVVGVLSTLVCNHVLQDICDGLLLLLVVDGFS
jgi:hypothetical protein